MKDSTNPIRRTEEIRSAGPDNHAVRIHAAVSFGCPKHTATVNDIGVLRDPEAIRIVGLMKHTHFYHASTSVLCDAIQNVPQREATPFYLRSPYAAAKLYGYWFTVNDCEADVTFTANGILFNQESPVRGEPFVTRKIIHAVARIEAGLDSFLWLGILDSKRGWGHVKGYLRWMTLKANRPGHCVLAGEARTVREFVERTFPEVVRRATWSGEGVEEVGADVLLSQTFVQIDWRYFHPAEVNLLAGGAQNATHDLGCKLEISFAKLDCEIDVSELKAVKREVRHGRH